MGFDIVGLKPDLQPICPATTAREHWKPQEFAYDVLDCRMGIHFPVAKLLDYADREIALHDDPNPFAWVTLAHLQTRATRQDPQARFDAKWKLVQLFYRRSWDKPRLLCARREDETARAPGETNGLRIEL